MARRENEEVEFKKTTSELREGVISLSSMLNKSNHGVVYFGIRNDGSVFGLDVGINTTTNILTLPMPKGGGFLLPAKCIG